MKKRTKWLVAAIALLSLVWAACGSDDDDSGSDETTTTTTAPTTTAAPATTAPPEEQMDRRVQIFGPETANEGDAIQDAFDLFQIRTGIEVVYSGAQDFSDQINTQAAGGNPPDIAVFPQPGKVAEFADQDFVVQLPADVDAAARANWNDSWMAFGAGRDGNQYGIPTKADLKSLVWYNVPLFTEAGYSIPQTWDELKGLTTQMIADGHTPWCVGIESGPATGWPFTDWVEDLMLRYQPPEIYDEWVAGTVQFSDERVSSIFAEILDLWNTEDAVYAPGGTIAASAFRDNGQPLVDGDCLMHKQASFFAAFLPAGTKIGPTTEDNPTEIDVFYFPAIDPATQPTLVAGTVVAAFRDAPEVWEVMKYFATPEYAVERQKAQKARQGGSESGFLSAASGQDLSYYSALEQSFVEILQNANPARFDGSDLMPPEVGSNSFWTESTSFINGDITLEEAVANIDKSWPS